MGGGGRVKPDDISLVSRSLLEDRKKVLDYAPSHSLLGTSTSSSIFLT